MRIADLHKAPARNGGAFDFSWHYAVGRCCRQRLGRASAAERTILSIQGEGIAKYFADGYNEKDYIR